MTHQTISFIKSAIRIVGYCAIINGGFYYGIKPIGPSLLISGVLLVVSEIVGIVEEIGER